MTYEWTKFPKKRLGRLPVELEEEEEEEDHIKTKLAASRESGGNKFYGRLAINVRRRRHANCCCWSFLLAPSFSTSLVVKYMYILIAFSDQ